MQRFHERHGKAITLSRYNSRADVNFAREIRHLNNVFSEQPLLPGESFTFRLVEVDQARYEYLYLGVTGTDPAVWDGQTPVYGMEDTWTLQTEAGYLRGPGTKPNLQEWSDNYLSWHRLRQGDRLSICLQADRSVDISYNDQKFTGVFRDLPEKDLWVTIALLGQKIDIVQRGTPGLQEMCAFQITELFKKERTEMLPIPTHLQLYLRKFY